MRMLVAVFETEAASCQIYGNIFIIIQKLPRQKKPQKEKRGKAFAATEV